MHGRSWVTRDAGQEAGDLRARKDPERPSECMEDLVCVGVPGAVSECSPLWKPRQATCVSAATGTSHPVNARPSETDKQTWLSQLKKSTLEKWHSIIPRPQRQPVARHGWPGRHTHGTATTGSAETVATPGLTAATSELARDLASIAESGLPSSSRKAWIRDPSRLTPRPRRPRQRRRREAPDEDARNERTAQAARPLRISPLLPLPRREAVVPGGEFIHGGQTMRRVFTPPKITVR